jgi:CRISPR/Cas system CSM-associated protein Csm4 (group 5 of RAMP superfamily)
MPEFEEGVLPDLILAPQAAVPQVAGEEAQPTPETVYWLLSLFSPAPQDSVDWKRGSYSLLTRGGRVESPTAFGLPKKLSRMIAEGSVIFAQAPVRGGAHDVSPDGFPHPVYRAGFALAVPIPWRVT